MKTAAPTSATATVQTGNMSSASPLQQYYSLTKPRVVRLLMFCALVGMVLAVPGIPTLADLLLMAVACLGIWMITAAAAAVNCLLEKAVDARMQRTMLRPTVQGELTDRQVVVFSVLLCGVGCAVLLFWVNALTMWLTLATFVGYAFIYTLWLKPNTPQNIVIGGATGAMPPVLGWAAMTGATSIEAWILFLIIFIWTPPHFWPLSMYRINEYRQSGLPMMPVVRGIKNTCFQVFVYTILLFIACLLPFIMGYNGWLYLAVAIFFSTVFIAYAWLLWRDYSPMSALKTFRFSLLHLSMLFLALLIDHYLVY